MQGSTALIGTEAGSVLMFSLADGSCELVLSAQKFPVTALDVCWSVCGAFDGPVAVSGASNGLVHAWSLLSDSGDPPLAVLEGHGSAITSLVLYGRGARSIAASQDGTAIVWDVVSGSRLAALSGGGGRMTTLAMEPRRERYALTATDDGHAAIWALDASVRRIAPLMGSTSFIATAAFLPTFVRGTGGPEDLEERSLAVTAGGDGLVAVWDCLTGQRLRLLSGHYGEVHSLDVSAKGRFLLTAGADGTCRLWDLHSHIVEPPVPHAGGVQVCATLALRPCVCVCASRHLPPQAAFSLL
jgi:WD40 repeat protein